MTDVGLAMQDLMNNRIDAVIRDDPVTAYYANKSADTAGKLEPFVQDRRKAYRYGFTVRKGCMSLLKSSTRASSR